MSDYARKIRVLIVDDSAVMRQSVRRILDADPDVEVIDAARDGLDALLKVEKLQPDVVTMDVEMPTLDGLSALRLLMERFPRPVVMFSSLTKAGAEATVKALSLGAVDFMCKPSGQSAQGMSQAADELVAKIKRASRARPRRPLPAPVPSTDGLPSAAARPRLGVVDQRSGILGQGVGGHVARSQSLAPGSQPASATSLVVIGSSTGGPRALAELMAGLPPDLPCPVLIVQHLPAGFTRSLAERLDHGCALAVSEARDGEPLAPGHVLVAPGDFHLKVVRRRVGLEMGPRRHGVRPSVDTALESAAISFGPAVLTVILTGMGEDGTEGARAIKAAGGGVLAEAESTCVVYGMPRSVVEAGLADDVIPLPDMAAAIARRVHTLTVPATRRLSHAG